MSGRRRTTEGDRQPSRAAVQQHAAGPPKEQRRPGKGGVERVRGVESRKAETRADDAAKQVHVVVEPGHSVMLDSARQVGTLAAMEFEMGVCHAAINDLLRGRKLDRRDAARLYTAIYRTYRFIDEMRPAGMPNAKGLGRR